MDFDQDLNSSLLVDLLAGPLSALDHPGGGGGGFLSGTVLTEGALEAAAASPTLRLCRL